jgi:hypothetical protein
LALRGLPGFRVCLGLLARWGLRVIPVWLVLRALRGLLGLLGRLVRRAKLVLRVRLAQKATPVQPGLRVLLDLLV